MADILSEQQRRAFLRLYRAAMAAGRRLGYVLAPERVYPSRR
jgi:hypothetical protein